MPVSREALFGRMAHEAGRSLLAGVCLATSSGLPDDAVRAAAAEEPPEGWLAAAAERTSLTALLWTHLSPGQRRLLPGHTRQALSESYLAAVLRLEAMQRLLGSCLERLQGAGIEVLLLKGAALGHTVYPLPDQRDMRDLDLLVRDERLHEAQALLLPEARQVRRTPSGHRHLGAVILRGAFAAVEVHALSKHLADWPQSGQGDLFARSVPVVLGGREALALGPRDCWLHVAAHGLADPFSRWPRTAADLARLQADSQWGEEDWQAVLSAGRARGAERLVVSAAALANGGEVPEALASAASVAAVADAATCALLGWRVAFEPGAELRNALVHRAWVHGGPGLRALAAGVARELPVPIGEAAERYHLPRRWAAVCWPLCTAARTLVQLARTWRWYLLLRHGRP